MNTHTLIQNLSHSDPQKRFEATLVLGMVDEIEALSALGKAHKKEPNPIIKNAMGRVGRQLQMAHSVGCNTFDEIWWHFGIQQEVDGGKRQQDPDEKYHLGLSAHELEMLSRQTSLENQYEQLAAKWSSFLLRPQDNIVKKMDAYASASGDNRSQRRAAPIQPATTDIAPHVYRLLHHADVETRCKAARTLYDINNPAALPALARAFTEDASPDVKLVSQFFGKRLYWNLLYWEMERDGTIKREIQRRRALLGLPPVETDINKRDTTEADRKRIDDLLKRGQEKHRRRWD